MFVDNAIRKIRLISLVLLVFLAPAFGGNEKQLSGGLIKSIRSDFRMNTQTRAMYNAISNTDIKKLTLNRELLRDHNDFFSNKIKVKKITSQKSSGRCWMFAALNSLRPQVIKKNNLEDFQFSHIFLAFWDKMEKSNTFYENIIRFRQRNMMDRELVYVLRGPIGDGGYWENAKNLIEKYGVVPDEAMPETHSSNNTSIMNKVLARKLRVDAVKLRRMAERGTAVKALRKAKEKMLGEVYRVLVMNYGQPPAKFDWRYQPKAKKDNDKKGDKKKDEAYKDKSIIIKDCTPKQFYKKFVGIDLNEYVDLVNAAPHKLHKRYQVKLTRNLADGDDLNFANISMKTMKSIAVKSLKDGSPMWFSADVSIDQSSDVGIMANSLFDYETLFGVNLKMTRAELALFRQAVPNHAMNFLGVDIQDGKIVKWLVENSWGTDRGNKGFWTMYDDWFDANVFSIIVKKKYVPKEILKILEQDPIILPVWDPMW